MVKTHQPVIIQWPFRTILMVRSSFANPTKASDVLRCKVAIDETLVGLEENFCWGLRGAAGVTGYLVIGL